MYSPHSTKTEMLAEAVEHYLEHIKENFWDCDEMLEAYNKLFDELCEEQEEKVGLTE
jgi:hypothetical protein